MLGKELRSWEYLKSLHNRELRSYPQVSKHILGKNSSGEKTYQKFSGCLVNLVKWSLDWESHQADGFELEIFSSTLPSIIMEVENGCPSNISLLSFRVIFHFHDYGRKGIVLTLW